MMPNLKRYNKELKNIKVLMTSVSLIFRFYVRNQHKRKFYIDQYNDRIELINLLHSDVSPGKNRINEWSGQTLQKYFDTFDQFNPEDFECQILFLKRARSEKEKFPAQISFPGGKHEAGETYFETAIRETLEETNLNLKDESKFAY